jgi:hypothetical protein
MQRALSNPAQAAVVTAALFTVNLPLGWFRGSHEVGSWQHIVYTAASLPLMMSWRMTTKAPLWTLPVNILGVGAGLYVGELQYSIFQNAKNKQNSEKK